MSHHVPAKHLVPVSLATGTSPFLCGEMHPASHGCDGAAPPRRCRRTQTLARCAHPHLRSHLNRSPQALLPQQTPSC